MRRLDPLLSNATRLLHSSRSRLGGVDHRLLVPTIGKAVADLRHRDERETPVGDQASEAVHLLPRILGATSPRRYFLAFQHNAELRGTGGLMGNWGELGASGGRARLTRFGRLQELNDAGIPTRSRVLHVSAEFRRQWRDFA